MRRHDHLHITVVKVGKGPKPLFYKLGWEHPDTSTPGSRPLNYPRGRGTTASAAFVVSASEPTQAQAGNTAVVINLHHQGYRTIPLPQTNPRCSRRQPRSTAWTSFTPHLQQNAAGGPPGSRIGG